jgi:hypothetical protein
LNADPDLDPATQINADPCGSGSETLNYKQSLDYNVLHLISYASGAREFVIVCQRGQGTQKEVKERKPSISAAITQY